MKVTINAGGREITLETGDATNSTVGFLADTALRLWEATHTATPPTTGPGFAIQQERRNRTTDPTHLGPAGMQEVKA